MNLNSPAADESNVYLMVCSGTLDSEQTFQLYRRFMEVVETNDRSRKTSVKPTSTVSSSSSLSSNTAPRTELPNYQATNGAVPTGSRQRESLLSSRPTSSSDSSATVSPLTGTRLVSRNAAEDVASPRIIGKYPSSPSYSNGLTTESYVRGVSSSPSSYSSRLTPLATTQTSPFSSRFDSASDSFASRVGSGGTSGYGERSPDVATSSYLAKSRLDDASSPAARLQSLRDSYCSTMWNDSVSTWGGGGGDVVAPSAAGLSRLTSYDADPTTAELLSATAAAAPASSRYERVMSARSRSAIRRGDVMRDGVVTAAATRSRITSPVAAARTAMNDLSDVLLSSSVEHPAPARSTPISVSSRAERMKLYGIGTTSSTQQRDQTARSAASPPPRSTVMDKLATPLSETTTMLPSTEHDRTSSTRTVSDTSRLKTSPLVNGTEQNLTAEISQTPDVDKPYTQRAAAVLPTAHSPKTVTVNGGKKSPEVRGSRLRSVTSSTPVGFNKNTENGKVAESTSDLKTTASESKSVTTSGAKSSETERPRKTDADDIAGSSLSAATLNRLQAAAAAAANAVVSAAAAAAASARTDSMQKTSPGNVGEMSSSSSEHRTTTENRVGKDVRDSVDESLSSSPSRNRTRARAPATLQEMLIPSDDQKNAKSPEIASRTHDAASRQLNGAPSSSVSKAAKSVVDSASKSTSAKSDGAVKTRSRTLVNVHEMLVPAPSSSSSSGVGSNTERRTANVASTSSGTTASTGRSRTSSTSSTTSDKKPEQVRPAKPGSTSQPPRRQAPSVDAASRSPGTPSDRSSAHHRPISLQQTHTTPASKVIRSVDEKKMVANKTPTATKQTSAAAGSKTATTTTAAAGGEDDWKTTLAGIIQASDAPTPDDQHGIQPSASISSLVSEPASRTRHVSADLSSLMRPTASSMARRGSAGDTARTSSGSASRPSYAAPTSSSASRAMSAVTGMSRTTSSPALPGGAGRMSLSTPPSRAAAAGSASGRTTPTGARRTADTAAQQASTRLARTTNSTSAATARPTRPGTATTTTPGRTNSVQRGAARATTNSRSRHNSSSSTGSGAGDVQASRR